MKIEQAEITCPTNIALALITGDTSELTSLDCKGVKKVEETFPPSEGWRFYSPSSSDDHIYEYDSITVIAFRKVRQ